MSAAALTRRIHHAALTIIATVTTIIMAAALVTVLTHAGPASAETPAERCARETSAYNSAWAASWAASNPGQSAADAPPPPVPYVCVEPQDPTTTPTSPTTTAPGLPEPDEQGSGPNVGAHAPTDIPPPGETPIVAVPGVDGVQRSAAPQEDYDGSGPSDSVPGALSPPLPTFGRHSAKDSGLPPYAACGSSSERKQIGEYAVQGGKRAFMVCGNRDYGFEHIKGEHRNDWSNKAMITGDKWMDLMDVSIEATLKHPEASSQRDGKTCYARKIWMYDKRNGELTGNFFWSNVIVKDSNGSIITAYPTSGAHQCK